MVEASVGKRERLGQSLGGDISKSNHLPGLTAAGSIGVNTSYNGFEIYGGGGHKSTKSGGRNGTHQSGKSMRVSNQVKTQYGGQNKKMALNLSKTATDKMF